MTDPQTLVLDASALIAYARNEPGVDVVAARLRSGSRIVVSAVNWAEAIGKLREYRMTPTILRQALAAVDAEVVPFSQADADRVGELTPSLRPQGLSLGDRACLALAISLDGSALTADRTWSDLELVGMTVEMIR